MVGPAAVRIVAFRITVVRDAKGAYVLGKGSAFGVESAPLPGARVGAVGVAARPAEGVAAGGPDVGARELAEAQARAVAERASAVTTVRISGWVLEGG